MTCIAGIAQDGNVYIGGDSAGVSDWDTTTLSSPKVFHVGDFLIGYTSSFRMGQLLQYQLSVKEQDGECDRAYMITVFAEAVREVLKSYGYASIDNNTESGGAFLVGYRGRLYGMGQNFAVLERADMFDAVGCGKFYALGALAVNVSDSPKDRITEALTVSAHFCAAVRAPFHIEAI